MRILVTGASGFVGQRLIQDLLCAEYEVVAFVRNPAKAESLKRMGASLVQGDVTDGASLDRAVQGSNAVVHAAAATSEATVDANLSERVNVRGVELLIQACRRHGTKRVVYISTQSAKRVRPGPYGETKKRAEELLLSSGLDVTILRPTLIYGPGNRGLFAKMIRLLRKLPIIPIIGDGHYHIQPCYVGDVAAAVIAALKSPLSIGKIYDIAGADRMTFSGYLRIVMREIGVRKKFFYLPVPIAFGMARLASVTMAHPPITVDNALGLVQETGVDPEPAARDLGFKPVSFRVGLRWALKKSPETRPGFRRARFGLVGFGKMGLIHACLLNVMPEADLVAIADPRRIGTYARSMGFDVLVYDSLAAMLEDVELDAVIACVPPVMNPQLAELCLAQKVALLVEKPLAAMANQAHRMLEFAMGHPEVPVAVGYMLLHVPLFKLARRLLAESEIGEVVSYSASSLIGQVHAPVRRRKGWRFRPEESGGGALAVIGSHMLHFLRECFGLPVQVKARIERRYSDIDDDATLTLTHKNGVTGTFRASWSEAGFSELTHSLVVEGTRGELRLENELLCITSNTGAEKRFDRDSIQGRALFDIAAGRYDGDGYYFQDLEFVKAVLANKPIKPCPWAGAVQVQDILSVAYLSAQEGQPRQLAM